MTPRKPGSGRGGQERIAAHLHGLASGLADGERLPVSVESLAREHGVSESTAYRAARVAEARGYITMTRGHGMFARHFRPVLRHVPQRLRRFQWQHGPGIQAADAAGRANGVDRIVVERLPSPPPIAADLGPGPVIERSRRYLLDGVPVMTATAWYPQRIVAGTRAEDDDTGPGGVYARLAEAGFTPTHFREIVTARPPTDAEITELALPPRMSIVIEVTRFAADQAGRLVEVQVMVLDARQYTLIYEVEA